MEIVIDEHILCWVGWSLHRSRARSVGRAVGQHKAAALFRALLSPSFPLSLSLPSSLHFLLVLSWHN